MNVTSRAVSESPGDVEISIDHATFVWDGASWYDKRTFLTPPLEKVHQLNRQLEERLASADRRLTNPFALVQEATRAKNAEQHQRAVRLARRALCFSARDEAAATVLSSALRAMGKANEALAATDAFPRSFSAPLLTTRAAAQCDLGRWPEALRTVRRALAASSGHGDAAFAVLNRIRAAAPDLF